MPPIRWHHNLPTCCWKNPSLLDSCQSFPSNPSKQQETENGIPSERSWKGRHWAGRQERGGLGWGGGCALADPLLSVQRGLFSSALRSEWPTGDLRSEGCFVSQDKAIFKCFYEMSIGTPRTGHRGSDSTWCPLWAISSPAFKDLHNIPLYQSGFILLMCPKAVKNTEKLEAC